jgi:hypothetical protein
MSSHLRTSLCFGSIPSDSMILPSKTRVDRRGSLAITSALGDQIAAPTRKPRPNMRKGGGLGSACHRGE